MHPEEISKIIINSKQKQNKKRHVTRSDKGQKQPPRRFSRISVLFFPGATFVFSKKPCLFVKYIQFSKRPYIIEQIGIFQEGITVEQTFC